MLSTQPPNNDHRHPSIFSLYFFASFLYAALVKIIANASPSSFPVLHLISPKYTSPVFLISFFPTKLISLRLVMGNMVGTWN